VSSPPAPEVESGALGSANLLDSPEAGGVAIRGSAIRGVGYAVTVLLSLVSAPLLTRHLGVVGFGRYTQVASLIALVGAVTEAGLGILAVREYVVLTQEGRQELVRNLLGLRLALTLGGVVVAAAFAALAGYGGDLVLGTVAAGAGLVAYVTQNAYAAPLAADLRLGWMTVIDIARQGVFVLLVVALVLAGATVVPLLAVPIAAGVVALVATVALVRGRVSLRPGFEVTAWRSMLRETLPLAASTAIYSVYLRVVVLLMSLLSGAVQAGYYALSFRVVETLAAVPFVLIGALLPVMTRAAQHDRDRFRETLQGTFEVSVIAGLGMTVVTAMGARLAINVLSPHAGQPAVGVLEIQSLALALAFLTTAWGLALVTLRRHLEIVVANAAGLVALVVLAVVLVPVLGARGGALASVIGETVLMATYVVQLHRVRPDLGLRLGVVPRAMLAAGAAVLAAKLSGFGAVAAPIVAGTAYVAGVVVLRAIPAEVRTALTGRWRRRG